MKKSVIIIDILALIGFLISYAPNLTGYAIHEWLGLAVGTAIFVHLLQHWQWILNVTQSLGHAKKKLLIRYILNISLLLFFFLIIVTGLMISSLMNFPLTNYELSRVLHVVSSYGTLVMIAFKVAIHWDWVSKQYRKMTGIKAKKAAPHSTRRAFLRTGAITSLAAVVALVEFDDWKSRTDVLAAPIEESLNLVQIDEAKVSKPTVVPTEIEVVEAQGEMPNMATQIPTSTLVPTIEPTVTFVVAGVVRCNKKCSYPGRCSRYQDDNQNGKCDLGEPIW